MEAAATVRRAMKIDPVRPLDRNILSDSARRNAINHFYEGSVDGMVSSGRKGHRVGMAYAFDAEGGWKGNAPLYQIWLGKGPLESPQDNAIEGFRLKKSTWLKWKAGYVKAVRAAQAMIPRRLRARGLTQKSWYDLLVSIAEGKPVDAPAIVKRARPVQDRSRTVAAALPTKTPTSFVLDVVNDSGLASATGGQRKLNTAISIRRTFFRRNLEKGFMSDAKFIARNYPWASVK